MTNLEAIHQLRETASPSEALAMLRTAIAALIARGAKSDEIAEAVDRLLAIFAECERIDDLRHTYWN